MTSKKQVHWHEHVAAARDADVPLAEYARRHGIKVRSLYNAKRKAGIAKTLLQGQETPLQGPRAGKSAFVPVVIKSDALASNGHAETLALRAELPNGVQLAWVHRAGDRALADVLQALAGLSCSS